MSQSLRFGALRSSAIAVLKLAMQILISLNFFTKFSAVASVVFRMTLMTDGGNDDANMKGAMVSNDGNVMMMVIVMMLM